MNGIGDAERLRRRPPPMSAAPPRLVPPHHAMHQLIGINGIRTSAGPDPRRIESGKRIGPPMAGSGANLSTLGPLST